MPKIAKKYLENSKDHMQGSFRVAQTNKTTKMILEKINHDRKIKKHSYNVGDFVLCDLPRLKKGLSKGITH
jgi:hypothetical protein